MSSCQEDVIPDQPFQNFGETISVARSGDGTELKGVIVEDDNGDQVVLFKIGNVHHYDTTYKINSWFTKDRTSFIRLTHEQEFNTSQTVNYMGSYVSDQDKVIIATNDLISIEVRYFDQGIGHTIVKEFIPYDSRKYKELFLYKIIDML